MGNVDLLQINEGKYLIMHLRRRLTWVKQIKTRRKELNLKAKHMHLLFGRSTLSIESKFLLYKAVLKPIWTCVEFCNGRQSPIPTSKSSGAFNPRLSDPFSTNLAT
jgi:hypothetical protein